MDQGDPFRQNLGFDSFLIRENSRKALRSSNHPQLPCFTQQIRNRFVSLQTTVSERVVNAKTHLFEKV
jgi:hypothetical protein